MLEGSPEQSWGEYHKGVHDITVTFLEAQKPVKPDTHGGEGNARKLEEEREGEGGRERRRGRKREKEEEEEEERACAEHYMST